ncbi:2-polyprenyl-3-methyl-5-hydroxy-6-metoxy-1,4-benzoquinol methylase [Rhizobium skierniewicense]|uniref:2-polyprenyl-3-methyl-5-hydroxy-6-metoxy-1, 4-benzoquinol methylase n=1 Tax=Rhizobium skierniewicense TaxID=984260 RepID=A0A7W6C2K2_9HYPH|nr:class I SAM-dependent methyltransferase [Rhizobium skierniewicense]MBB3944607.1 2-polyprenyl-3-methyl-5-hydroxy-6-metoxy-1,4-benzoquinol methylase [Rhizobium skierniewicense]
MKVTDDEADFYGKKYWLEHQNKDLGFPNIFQRAKLDLTDRNLHWLRTLLKYKAPPSKVLELGCSHGSFVALLRQAGYEASGMEMSPWVVEYAQETFDIPVLVGPIENIELEAGTFDAVALMDVLEHLPFPKDTLTIALDMLKPDGLIMIQMPNFPGVTTFEELQTAHPSFLGMLLPDEHIYLYSQNAAQRLFQELGAEHLIFEKPFFTEHDMFFVVSRQPIEMISKEDAEKSIETPKGRFVQALLDQDKQIKSIEEHVKIIDEDRAARLDQIQALTKMIHDLQAAAGK